MISYASRGNYKVAGISFEYVKDIDCFALTMRVIHHERDAKANRQNLVPLQSGETVRLHLTRAEVFEHFRHKIPGARNIPALMRKFKGLELYIRIGDDQEIMEIQQLIDPPEPAPKDLEGIL
jgi:hypothetical protein